MLWAAMGGGLIMGLTTRVKIGILGLKAALFWTGLLAGLNCAVSFVIVQLLHWTIATKQPAMTAPALADRLGELSHPGGVERFVDEVANLTRSQAAGVFGNVLVVMPVALLLGLVGLTWFGAQFLPVPKAEHELQSLSLLGPMPLYAASTGILQPPTRTKETLKKSASGMERKAHGAQRLKPIKEIGEEANAAQRSNPPAQPFIQRFPKH